MDNNACLGAYAEEGAARGEGSGCWPRGARSEASAPLSIGGSSRSGLQEALACPGSQQRKPKPGPCFV